MNSDIFKIAHYKDYLRGVVGGKRQRRGVNAALAAALRCQPTYISQVIHGAAQLSLEQAEMVGRFFGLSKDEQKYFRLLVQRERAGTKELKNVFQEELEQLAASRLILKERLGAKNTLSEEDRAKFYSSWHFAAFHIAVTIPELQSRAALARYFHLPVKKVSEVLEFLLRTGLVNEEGGKLGTGIMEMRLGNDSSNILKHHSNWRIRAVDSLDKEELRELHYSAVVSLSRADVLKIKEQILDGLKKNLDVVKASKEEELFCYTIDFFSLKADR